MGKISEHLVRARFIRVRKGDKKPHGEGDWNEKLISYIEANNYLLEDYNIGMVAGEGIVIIDADKPESVEWCDKELPLTYTEETCSGGRHYVYFTNDKLKNTLIGKDKGEIRCERQYVVIAPSKALNKQGVIKEYVVVRDVPMGVIDQSIIDRLTSHFNPAGIPKLTKGLTQKKAEKKEVDEEVISKLSAYMKDLILTQKTKDELQLLGFPSRSERDCKIITHLLNRGFGQYITSIFKLYPCGDKYREHSAPDKYLQKTIDESIEFLGLRTQEDIQLEFEIESSNPSWLKRHLDKYLTKISEVKDNTNLFKESLIATLAFRLKLSQQKLDKRVKELKEANTPKQIISLFNLSQLNMIAQEYWVEPLIPKGTIIILGSKPGEGKSLFLQALTTSILTRGEFINYKTSGELPKILIYSVDDSSEKMLQSRHHFIVNGIKHLPGYNQSNLKNCDTSFTFNKHNLNREVEFALKYDIIVLDSYRRVLTGTENDSDITDAFFGEFLKPLKEAGKTIIVIHHLRKTNLDDVSEEDLQDCLRGSGDVVAQVDLAFILRSTQTTTMGPMLEGKDCTLKVVKNRLGIPFRDLKGNYNSNVCYRVTKDSNKVSTIFEYLDPSVCKTPKERRVDKLLRLLEERGTLTRQQLVKELTQEFHCSENIIEKDIDSMSKSGEIVKEKFGSYSLREKKNESTD